MKYLWCDKKEVSVNKKQKEKRLAVNTSFEDIIKASVSGNPAPKSKDKKLSVQDKMKVVEIIHKHLLKKNKK